jgi:hypothetical protein
MFADTCMYVCVCECVYVCVCVMHIYVYVRTRMFVRAHVCLHVHTCSGVHIHIHIHVHAHVHVHTYIHIHKQSGSDRDFFLILGCESHHLWWFFEKLMSDWKKLKNVKNLFLWYIEFNIFFCQWNEYLSYWKAWMHWKTRLTISLPDESMRWFVVVWLSLQTVDQSLQNIKVKK